MAPWPLQMVARTGSRELFIVGFGRVGGIIGDALAYWKRPATISSRTWSTKTLPGSEFVTTL